MSDKTIDAYSRAVRRISAWFDCCPDRLEPGGPKATLISETFWSPDMKATTKDLRLKTRELIAATDRGEEILITFRGQPRARLVPLSPSGHEKTRKGRNPVFGLRGDQGRSVAEHIDRLRQARSFE